MSLRYIVVAVLSLALLVGGFAIRPSRGEPSPSAASIVVRVSGSGTALPILRTLTSAYEVMHPGGTFQFDQGTNSGGAIKGVVDGTLDLAVTNRPLNEDESASRVVYLAFARDAVVFAVHLPNAIDELSQSEIQGVFSGDVTSWLQLGGSAVPIIVLDRDPDESMRKLVLLPFMDGIEVGAGAVVLSKAEEMITALSGTPNALGYTSLGLLRVRDPSQVRILRIDGVLASSSAVADGTYPWTMTFGLVHGPDAPAALRDFVDWTAGPEAEAILAAYDVAPALD